MRYVFIGLVFFLSAASLRGADYATTVLSDSPTAYYRLDEVSGTTAFDSALPAHDGTYANNPLLNQPGPNFPGLSPGNVGIQLNGADGGAPDPHVFNGALPFSNTTTYSAEGWVNNTRATNAAAITGYILSRGSSVENTNFDALGIGGTFGGIQGKLFLFNTSTLLPGHSSITNNEWHHVAYTRSGNTVALYLDGALQRTSTTTLTNMLVAGTSNNFYAGTRSDGRFPLQGGIDEVAVYDNKVLTGKQINAHYNAAFSTGLYSIHNGDFELQDIDVSAGINLNQSSGTGDGFWSDDIIRGWTGNNRQYFGVMDPTNAQYTGTTNDMNPIPGGNGDQVGYITINSLTPTTVSVSQTLPDPIQAGEFEFTMAIGSRLDRASAGYLLELLAGETVVAQEADAINLNDFAGTLNDRTISFTVPEGSDYIGELLTLRISNTIATGFLSTDFDNARLVFTPFAAPAAVPEPSSVMVWLLAIFATILSVRWLKSSPKKVAR